MGWFCSSCSNGPWGVNDGHCHECGAQKSRKHNATSYAAKNGSTAAVTNQSEANDAWYCPKCHDGPYGVIQDECQKFGCYGKKPNSSALDSPAPASSLVTMVDLDIAVPPCPSSAAFNEFWITGESGNVLRHSYRTRMRMRGRPMRACMAVGPSVDDV